MVNYGVLKKATHPRDMAIELYYRGKYDKAEQMARNALGKKDELSVESIVLWTNLLAMCQRAVGKYEDALRTHLEVAPLAETLDDVFLRGKFHVGLGITYRRLGQTDKSFEEYTAASVYYEMAGEHRHRADVENNLANLLIDAGRPEEAHAHLDKALQGCDDPEIIGQIEDVRARVFRAEQRHRDAIRISAMSVLRLLGTENDAALDESIKTLGEIAVLWPQLREAERIKKALMDASGHVQTAARILGYKNRQTLENKLKRHFPYLESLRSPKRKRTKRA